MLESLELSKKIITFVIDLVFEGKIYFPQESCKISPQFGRIVEFLKELRKTIYNE